MYGSQRYAFSNALKPCRTRIPRSACFLNTGFLGVSQPLVGNASSEGHGDRRPSFDPSRYNSFWPNKPLANRAIRPHTHKLPLDVSSHLGVPMPGHMMSGLCNGVRHATPHSQNTGPFGSLQMQGQMRSKMQGEYRLGNRATCGSCYNYPPLKRGVRASIPTFQIRESKQAFNSVSRDALTFANSH